MANVSTVRTLSVAPSEVVVYATVAFVDVQETDMLIYDSSVVATSLGIDDPLDCTILEMEYSCSSLVAIPFLEFDATTDVLAWSLPAGGGASDHFDFRNFGGLPNYAGTGKTGDILFTTAGMTAGTTISFVLHVRPN